MSQCDLHQCDLHFDDSTAHATVGWFLSQLSLEESSVIGKALSSHDSNYSDAEKFRKDLENAEKLRKDLENLCKDLNAVRFIDCLRKQLVILKDSDDLFEHIIDIAKRLNKGGKWKDFPNLFILLFSIVQKRPDKSVKNTELYDIAEKLYKHFKEKHGSPEYRAFIFKIGFQLSRFQKNDESWQKGFAEFKTLYYKELSKLRWKYYSVDNPAEYSQWVIVRWKRLISDSIDHENKKLNPKYEELTQKFFKLDLSSAVMHPMSLELPILERSTEALRVADDFVRDLNNREKDNKKVAMEFNKELANKFRIVQWDLLVRSLVEESLEETLCFHPITDELKIPGIRDLDSFMIEFIEKTRDVERHFIPYDGEIPKKREDNDSPSTAISFFDNEEVKNCYESFRRLLPKVPDYHPDVYEDLVRSFANKRDSGESTNTILIEDGELSFFSLLWLLRYAVSKGEQTTEWQSNPESNPEKVLPVRFRPSEGDSPDTLWSGCNMYEFAEELGLIIRLTKEKCVLTRRWRSLVAWLRRLNDYFLGLPEDANAKELEQKLPVKTLDYKEEKKEEKVFVEELRNFFASEDLREKFNNELNIFYSDVFMSCTDFARKFGGLIELWDPLMKVESSGGLKDRVLLRCCRAGFIPLEHLFRAYQPYELHLLIQALNWEKSSVENVPEAPISLGFATIAGQIESSQNTTINSENSQDATKDFRHWMGPYRSLFSALSANIALPAVQEASEQIGKQDQQRYFAHQTSSLLHTIWQDPNRDHLDFHSGFALWLANIQVDEVWGSFPIDPREPIPNVFPNSDDFPQWKSLDEIQTVDKLVDLGLWGGIMRALKPRKNGGINPVDYRLSTHAVLLKALGPKGAISQVRNEILPNEFLSSKSHNNIGLPQWVKTKAFAMCFYHGMRQATYHALETYVLDDNKQKQEGKPCLSIEWNNQSVSILNRGKTEAEHRDPDFSTDDRMFFEIVAAKINEFCQQNKIPEKYEIDGPEPNEISDIWQLVIIVKPKNKETLASPGRFGM